MIKGGTAVTARLDRVIRFHVADIIGEFPLEIGLSAWGVIVGISTVIGVPPSRSLQNLPVPVIDFWGAMMSLAAATIIFGMWVHYSTRGIASGLRVFLSIFLVYGIAVAGFSQAPGRAGAAGLFFILGFVCLLRSQRVRLIGEVIEKEIATTEHVGED